MTGHAGIFWLADRWPPTHALPRPLVQVGTTRICHADPICNRANEGPPARTQRARPWVPDRSERRPSIPAPKRAACGVSSNSWRHAGSPRLYTACDGLSFPDVHNGYFIKPLDRLIHTDLASEPNKVLSDDIIDVFSFGSTGNGSLFVVDSRRGSVLLLPPGPMTDGLYDGRRLAVRRAAAIVPLFVERLLEDLTAFVKGDTQHERLASRSA